MMLQANILVDETGNPQINDFGLAKIIDSQATMMGPTLFNGAGAVRWQAAELLSTDTEDMPPSRTKMGDVYAYACVCLEVRA